jgi:hypothetical protein
VSHK